MSLRPMLLPNWYISSTSSLAIILSERTICIIYCSIPSLRPGFISSIFCTDSLKISATSPFIISSRNSLGNIFKAASDCMILSYSSLLISSSVLATSRPAEAMKRAVCSSRSLSPTFSSMDISSFMPLSSSSLSLAVAKRFSACTLIGFTGCEARLMPLSLRK